MSLLALPTEVRQKIYSYAGLRRPCAIDMIHEHRLVPQRHYYVRNECVAVALAGGRYTWGTKGPVCICPDLPVQILRVCRQVYHEALPVLYGANDLMIIAHDLDELRAVSRMPLLHVEHMRSLLIRLNCWPCFNGHEPPDLVGQYTKCATCGKVPYKADSVLSLGTEEGQQTIAEWSTACSHLAQSLQPKQVHLSLIADVAGEEEAREIVKELRRLPTLKQLDLRLGRNREPKLRNIANETAEIMTARFRRHGVFPFERLPAELRQRILAFTDLASGNSPQWSREPRQRVTPGSHSLLETRPAGGYEWRSGHLEIREKRLVQHRSVGAPRSTCCRNCTLTAYGCCCRHAWAASSAYCLCRLIPFDLFYVSKAMYREATYVFYTRNPFLLHQPFSISMEFLNAFNASFLRLIRDITIQPAVANSRHYFSDDPPERGTFSRLLRELVDVLNEKLQLDAVSLTLDTTNHRVNAKFWREWQWFYEEHCDMVRQLREYKAIENVTIKATDSEWNDELMNQLAGAYPSDWPAVRKGISADISD